MIGLTVKKVGLFWLNIVVHVLNLLEGKVNWKPNMGLILLCASVFIKVEDYVSEPSWKLY